MKPITIVMPYYNQPLMLAHQLKTFIQYSRETHLMMYLNLVDDGSRIPAEPIVRESGILDSAMTVSLYHTLVDVPWNQEFAVNLGVSQVDTEWFAHIDIDHEMPEATARALIYEQHDPWVAYSFRRVRAEGQRRDIHEALFFMTKTLFMGAGGFDERFAGAYLPSDRDFNQRVRHRGHADRRTLGVHLITHDESYSIKDASAIQDQPHIVDAAGEAQYWKILAERGDGPTQFLTYPWERVL
jgi:hypothetical protein